MRDEVPRGWASAEGPPLEAFIGAGMHELERGRSARGDWVRLGYGHEGVAWQQIRLRVWHDTDAMVVVTVQAPAMAIAAIEAAAAEIVHGLRPRAAP